MTLIDSNTVESLMVEVDDLRITMKVCSQMYAVNFEKMGDLKKYIKQIENGELVKIA